VRFPLFEYAAIGRKIEMSRKMEMARESEMGREIERGRDGGSSGSLDKEIKGMYIR
jgi:hypothetical protein